MNVNPKKRRQNWAGTKAAALDAEIVPKLFNAAVERSKLTGRSVESCIFEIADMIGIIGDPVDSAIRAVNQGVTEFNI